jgi:hypothetical protein
MPVCITWSKTLVRHGADAELSLTEVLGRAAGDILSGETIP